MSKNWKQFERTYAERFSFLFFGVEKPKGGRIDKDCPLCRADDSGAHPSCTIPGDIVPNGLWIREGKLNVDDYPFIIEVKDFKKGLRFDKLLQGKSKDIFWKHWEQATSQALEVPGGIPILVTNQAQCATDFVVMYEKTFRDKNNRLGWPDRRFEYYFTDNPDDTLIIFTFAEFLKANPVPPYKHCLTERD